LAMEAADADFGFRMTGQFLTTISTPHPAHIAEHQPFLHHSHDGCAEHQHEHMEQASFYSRYKQDILRLRTPIIILIYHYLGYLYTVPYLPISHTAIVVFYIQCSIILFMTYLTFYIAAYSHPGKVPTHYLLWNGSMESKPKVPLYAQVTESTLIACNYMFNINDKEKLFCQKCNKHRPLRAHHCSTCNDCICRMDHHCWFLNNCVGINNHRYFIQFLVWLWLILMEYEVTFYVSKLEIQENESYVIYYAASTMFYVGILFELFVTGLFFTNFRCILNNQTYLEQKFSWDQLSRYGYVAVQCPFDQGSKMENFKTVFGTSMLAWFLPVSLSARDLDERLMHDSQRCDLLPCCRQRARVQQKP